MATTIDLGASRKVSGGVGDEESAPIDDRCDGCDRAVVIARSRRLWGRVGDREGWRGRRVGPMGCPGGPDGGRTAK